MATIQHLAKEAYDWLETGTREVDGIGKITVLRSGHPQWVTDLCRSAHDNGAYLPDDWRFDFIRCALSAICDYDDIGEAQDSACEPDVYTSELTAWLHSSNVRTAYLSEAMDEFGASDGDHLLAQAQY